jgi:pyridoxal phosphate enzyme (YggS family)
VGVAERLASVRERIAATGREPDSVGIVAVTKGFGPEMCRDALAAGLSMLGENRVQEALRKMEVVEGAQWHLVGHLQSNKVRHAAGRFAVIETVDSVRLAEQIAHAYPAQVVLIEVNIAREPQKSGVDPAQALEVARGVAGMLDLRGFMGMGPTQGDPRPAFEELRRLRDEAQERFGRPLPLLSMGMSGDFEAAVAAGSTLVRLGQVLFGPRPD